MKRYLYKLAYFPSKLNDIGGQDSAFAHYAVFCTEQCKCKSVDPICKKQSESADVYSAQ